MRRLSKAWRTQLGALSDCFATKKSIYSHPCRFRLFSSSDSGGALPKPTVLFSSNHLLVVNKPPGWQSIPNSSSPDHHANSSANEKCLLTYLKHVEQVGGGSDHTFLLPLHRLDQPCSGLLLCGKTSKAASRIQSKWSFVEKTYLVVVPTTTNHSTLAGKSRAAHCNAVLHGPEARGDSSTWMELQGLIRGKRPLSRKSGSHEGRGWSVDMIPWTEKDLPDRDSTTDKSNNVLCRLQWRRLTPSVDKDSTRRALHDSFSLLEVRTNQGARHMVRALFASHGCPLAGDLRYGASYALPDRSVALHAWRLVLPDNHIALNLTQRDFVAPIPASWEKNFGIRESIFALLGSEKVKIQNLN